MSEEFEPTEAPLQAAEPAIVSFPLPDDSHIQTFHLENANLRGRIIRIGKVLNDIIKPHNYPEAIEGLVAEAVTLALLLGSMLKYEGTFILQAQGDGAVKRIVSDMTSKNEVRGTAGFDAEKLNEVLKLEKPNLRDLMGRGYLAFTVDQGEFAERYQGIIELQVESLKASIQHYFAQSEQINTAINLATKRDEDGNWRAGAIMLQHMPEHEKIPQDAKPIAENWLRASILLETCKEEELLDPRLSDDTLLYRLFHEEGIRVFPQQNITKGCRCTPEKLQNVLKTLSEEDKQEAAIDGKITMTCEFCNRHFDFKREEI
ncbi:MAG: molecular chaperone [Micavibrio aeruginosavorus]|uniref:Molecular chaperone n=1 Tax=Micavibrio aeruginosavorus TaxID=349221 RepID=A0A2W5FCN8_9BACT|nr:MAG: molecular chaperone [Micavibrio aeruginosavorus]